ncbi:MAG: 16S rRNA (adenine(1518)-N(6)/adenine(1519)-N(6))-dimethyltransferase RsmA [Sedimentisphaerales bacterium]|jgi:16S rRNA (adenine1518-N6/adenine1519-N6)-dimethyltransferase
MQSKHQIRELLDSAAVRPNKRFGQNFLIDLNLMRLLIDTANIHNNDVVLEVGTGTGSLTSGIAEKAGFCVSVEIDATLASIARGQLADKSNVEIIAADVLKNKFEIEPVVIDALNRARAIHSGRLLLVANLPYIAATPLIINLVIGPIIADSMFVTVQKEVADRMISQPGIKDYGILSILLAATGEAKRIRTLKPTVFWPQPQVNSAFVQYVRDPEKVKTIRSVEMLSRVAGALLQHRRKMLKSCCKLIGDAGILPARSRAEGILPAEEFNWPEILNQLGIDPEIRPDNLTPEQFVAIANLCSESK